MATFRELEHHYGKYTGEEPEAEDIELFVAHGVYYFEEEGVLKIDCSVEWDNVKDCYYVDGSEAEREDLAPLLYDFLKTKSKEEAIELLIECEPCDIIIDNLEFWDD